MIDEDKQKLMVEYVNGAIRAMSGKEFENNCNLEYDKEDLSKANLFSRIFGHEINEEEKYKMLERASVGERYNISNSKGTYRPGFMARFINRFTRGNIKMLPEMGDIQDVANAYNKLRDDGNTDKITESEFLNNLKVSTKDKDGEDTQTVLNQEQKEELVELHKAQEKQEGR